MTPVLPPPIVFQGARWSSEVLAGTAFGWRASLGAPFLASTAPVALVMVNHPDAVALLFALSEQVRSLVERLAGPGRTAADAGPDTPLADGGFWLDSIEMMELIVSCEVEFAVVFQGETDVTPETLCTVRSLADLIRTKRAG